MLQPFEIRGGWLAWSVWQGDRKVSKDFTHKDNAEEAMTRLERRAREKPRNCLCCGASFLSVGPHNRLCNPCRGRSSGEV